MSRDRRLHLGAFMRPVGIHTAWWRYPGGYPDANFSLPHLAHFARRLEAGKFDAFFMADHLAVMNMPMAALRRSATVTSFDPLTLLPALAVLTERIGLVATASTTYNEPYHVARKFASLDHISQGRAGWNLVTSGNPDEALNFGRDAHVDHATRYARAREFFDVVTGLWDSWADDAFLMDPESGLFFDPEKMHVLDHRCDFLKVKGPLNVARPVQGWPVIVQAGASEAGRQIAAETAEVVFGSSSTLEAGRTFYADVKGRIGIAPAANTSHKALFRMLRSIRSALAAATVLFLIGGVPSAEAAEKTLRIGYQRSSTLIALLRQDSGLETALKPLGVAVSWHEFTSGLPIMEALNAGQIDVSADVADTVPIFAQAAGAKISYIAQEAPSPEAQAILVPGDSALKSVADLKGRRVAVTKGAGSHYLLLAALAEGGLSFKAITPAYLTPADGRAALASGGVDAWVAWDPFLSAARQQSGARVLRDGTGLSLYKRYYLASDDYVARQGDVLAVLFAKLSGTGAWVKAEPEAAAARLSPLWKIEADVIVRANARRSYKVEPVTRAGLSEQQTIADAFRSEGLLPRPVDASALGIWQPPAR